MTSIGHQGERLDGCQHVHALIQAASNPTATACIVLVHDDLAAAEAVQHGQEYTATYVHGTLQAAHQLQHCAHNTVDAHTLWGQA